MRTVVVTITLGFCAGCSLQMAQPPKVGPVPEPRDNGSPLTLGEAAEAGDDQAVAVLLAKGADRKTLNETLLAVSSFAPLCLDADTKEEVPLPPGYARTAELLLKKGASLEARDESGRTPLIAAATYGSKGIVALLLDKGAKIEATDNAGQTPLIAAACDCAVIDMPSTYDILKLLIEHGANIEARSSDGKTALMRAAASGHSGNVELLLERGADVNALDNAGNTALMLATTNSQKDPVGTVKALLGRGADPNLRNKKGHTALSLAVNDGLPEVAALLR